MTDDEELQLSRTEGGRERFIWKISPFLMVESM